tara:strand:+ start:274 stop:1194 length:921 start_codon:yes stop_codon:yes gene_type:complete
MQNNEEGRSFKASTIETIDSAILNHLKKLNLHVMTNKGSIPVPIIWVGAERTYQMKHDLTLRDSEGLLKLPLITIERKEMAKDPANSPLPSNIPDYGNGGYIPVRKRIVQDKTVAFKSAAAIKKSGASNNVGSNDTQYLQNRKFPTRIAKMFDTRPVNVKDRTVYETVYIPVPVYVNVKYEIHIRTEFQQQMNQLITPFIASNSKLGRNHKYFTMIQDEHLFEGMIDNTFSNDNNAAKLDEEERIFNSVVNIDVLGYLIGGGINDDINLEKKYENIVDVKISRERVILEDHHDRDNPNGTDPFYKE